MNVFRDYPETFRVREAMDINEEQTRPKKPNLAEIREGFCVRERQKGVQIMKV